MSSVFFDPATSAGQSAGTRKPSTPADAAVGGLSFDALLAKHQSSYEADTALRSEKSNSGRDYDRDRDYDSHRKDDSDFETDRSQRAERPEDDFDHRIEDDETFEDSSGKDRDDTASGEDEREDSASDHAVAAAQTDRKADTTETEASGDDVVAAASGPATTGTNANATSAAASSAATTDAQKTAAQTTQAAASQQAAASPKAAPTNTADGKQPTSGNATATANTSATASVTNAALVSQSNTALTSGAAVVTLQSVDPKVTAPAGTAMATDPLAVPQVEGDVEGEVAPKPVNTAAATAKPRPAGETGQPATAQAANVNSATAQAANVNSATGPTGMSTANAALPAATSETAAGVTATQATSGTPTFTSLTPVGGITQTANATGAGAAASGNASAAAATPSDQVAVEIRKGIATGKDQITIKLNPAELGKIDVKMELANDGTLRASIAVEKPETLDMLQKDIRGLERALQNAGLQADSGSLNFSLRGGEGGNQSNDFETASNAGSGAQSDESGAQDAAGEPDPTRRSSHDGALDISV